MLHKRRAIKMNLEALRHDYNAMTSAELTKARKVETIIAMRLENGRRELESNLAAILENGSRSIECELLKKRLSNALVEQTNQSRPSANYLLAAFCGAFLAIFILFIALAAIKDIEQDGGDVVNEDVNGRAIDL